MRFVPCENLADRSREIRPWLPTIRATLDALRDSDDITLVEVKQPGEEAHIANSGGSLVVDVHDPKNEVRVSTPIRAISRSPEELAAAAPSTEFEGEWQMVSAVMDGVPMEESTLQWVKRVTRGNQTTVIAGPQTIMKVEYTFDPSTKTIDYVNLAGAHKGKVQQGIYAFEGGRLKVSMAAPGKPRPGDFESVKGDGRTVTAWKRV
jgi:uncharacterized protein (TIGR03067 family)